MRPLRAPNRRDHTASLETVPTPVPALPLLPPQDTTGLLSSRSTFSLKFSPIATFPRGIPTAEFLFPRTVVRYRTADLVCAEIWRTPGKVVIHTRQTNTGIDGFRAGPQ